MTLNQTAPMKIFCVHHWSLNGFINYLPLPCRQEKNSFVKYGNQDPTFT